MSKLLWGGDFLVALEEAGVLQPEDKTRRVVIDARVDGAVVIYIENYGDERILDITTDPELEIGVRVRTTDMPDGNDDAR